jgi:hypothetical protein
MTDHSLTSRAMLCRMSVSRWTARRLDREASNEVAEINNASPDAGRFNKLLLDREHLAGVEAAVNAIRKHHDHNTLPWTITGVALLPAANYFDYMAEHRRLVAALAVQRDKLVASYDAAKEQRRAKLGDLYREEDYPEADKLAASIRSEIDVMPLPDASDFRVQLGDAEEARIRDEITASVNAAVAGAVRSLWDRVHQTVAHMHDRLANYEPAGDGTKAKNPFRDSLVENMRDMVALMGKLNISSDPALESIRRQMAEKLCEAEPQDLRDDDKLRARQAAEAKRILDLMAPYIGGGVQMAAE